MSDQTAPLSDADLLEVLRRDETWGRPPSPAVTRALIAEVQERRAAEERVRALVGAWRLPPHFYQDASPKYATLHDAAGDIDAALGGDQ